jgi:hypothetical protein
MGRASYKTCHDTLREHIMSVYGEHALGGHEGFEAPAGHVALAMFADWYPMPKWTRPFGLKPQGDQILVSIPGNRLDVLFVNEWGELC